MKLTEIIKILAAELGTSDLNEINKILKAKPELKFRLSGEALGHFGFTGPIKSISDKGVKVIKSNKVALVLLEEIETFGKPKPREARVAQHAAKSKPVEVKAVKAKASEAADEQQSFAGNDDDEGFTTKRLKKSKAVSSGKSGSKFIPTKK